MKLADTIYTFKDKVESVENDYILDVQRKLQKYEAIAEEPEDLPTWISVKDRLPKVEEEVLVCNHYDCFVAFYEDGNKKCSDSCYRWGDGFGYDGFIEEGWYLANADAETSTVYSVIAWMPLPKRYEEK